MSNAEEGAPPGLRIRPLDPRAEAELALVAVRMRDTLIEVLGEETGGAMYTLDWLERRVCWHLDPTCCTGEVFLAEAADGHIVGHTIVRVEGEAGVPPHGLFSTTYVAPAARRSGVAAALLMTGEAWMRARGLSEAVTFTDRDNTKLQGLYLARGYTLTPAERDFVRLAKPLARGREQGAGVTAPG